MRVSQTKLHSLVEQLLNVISGFLIALTLWTFIVVPWYNVDVTFVNNLEITGMFTVVSIIRGYFWRRLANWYSDQYNTHHRRGIK